MKKTIWIVLALVPTAFYATHNVLADEGRKNMTKTSSVILINPFTVPEGKLDEAIKSWENGRDFLSQQPGYISTKLHQSLDPEAQYALINVAEWETPAQFKAAIAAMRARSAFTPIEGVVPAPALYKVIRD